MRFVFIVHYYPPINSSGAKRAEALSKYLVTMGHHVTVITTRKSSADGEFTEAIPAGVDLIELDSFGRESTSRSTGVSFEPMYTGRPSWRRRTKDWVMQKMGQLPDPRLPFALAFFTPWLAARAKKALQQADVVIGSTPPWPMLLAALAAKRRFRVPCILDYRDHFSECHEMPGGPVAKWLEKIVDRRLVSAADHVVAISEPMSGYYRTMRDEVTTILNGYDDELIAAARTRAQANEKNTVTVRYMGIVSPGRIPRRFLEALSILQAEAPDKFARIRVEFFGNAALVEQALREHYPAVADAFKFLAPVPYLTSLQRIVEADYLLFCETSSRATLSAQGILTTKLFEYIGSGRPVLADISRETLAGALLVKCGEQHVVGDSVETFLEALRRPDFYQRHPDQVSEISTSLSRRSQARQYAALAASVAGTR